MIFKDAVAKTAFALIRMGFPVSERWRAKADAKAVFSGRSLLVCMKCGLGIVDPVPQELELARYYSRLYWSQHARAADADLTLEPLDERPFAQLAFVDRHGANPSMEKTLEFGAGSAGFTRALLQKSPASQCELVEASETMRHLHNKAGTADIVHGALGTANGPYDLIASSHSLEHVASVPSILAAFYGLLKPGGHLFVEVPLCGESYFSGYRVDTPHTWFFTDRSLFLLADTAGFETVKIEGWCAGLDEVANGGPRYFPNSKGSVLMALFRRPLRTMK